MLPSIEKVLLGLPLIEIEPGYWQRTGVLRAKLLGKGRKARLGDAPDFAELHGPEELLS